VARALLRMVTPGREKKTNKEIKLKKQQQGIAPGDFWLVYSVAPESSWNITSNVPKERDWALSSAKVTAF